MPFSKYLLEVNLDKLAWLNRIECNAAPEGLFQPVILKLCPCVAKAKETNVPPESRITASAPGDSVERENLDGFRRISLSGFCHEGGMRGLCIAIT
jgi:hypothetical protein